MCESISLKQEGVFVKQEERHWVHPIDDSGTGFVYVDESSLTFNVIRGLRGVQRPLKGQGLKFLKRAHGTKFSKNCVLFLSLVGIFALQNII